MHDKEISNKVQGKVIGKLGKNICNSYEGKGLTRLITKLSPSNQLTERTTNGQRKTNRKVDKGCEETLHRAEKSSSSQASKKKMLNRVHGKIWTHWNNTKRQLLSTLSLMAQMVKNLPAMQETQVQSLSQGDPLEKGRATHSSILAWRIPWTEEPGGLSVHGDAKSRTRLSN